jgi:hypothetical protein
MEERLGEIGKDRGRERRDRWRNIGKDRRWYSEWDRWRNKGGIER